jgi:amino acid adenylation domain-containing protein
LGDVKFHQHQGVDAAAAERWKGEVEDFLGEPTWALAEALGYERPAAAEGGPDRTAALGEIEPLVAAAEAAGTGAGAGPGDALPTFPLSFAQERLWVMDRLSPGLAAYNIPIAMTLDGPLEVEALQRALTEIVRRHGALRTTFQQGSGPQDDQPVQVIHPPATVPLPLEDLSGEADPLATARARAREEAATPFDLSVGPLLRARLFHLGPERHAALVTLHHIVSDGWSMGLLVEEVGRLYAAYSTADADAATETATGEGRPPVLPELAIQYADFAVWQRGWLQGAVLEDHLAYWRQQLAGVPNIELPTDRPRPAVQTFRGAIEKIRVPAATVSALSALGRAEGATLFMGLAAVFATLLGRLTGQRDFALGTPVANRTRAEVEPLIGLFINTLVLRADLGPGQGNEPTFREVLQRLRRVSVEAFNHQEVPFEKILEQLQPERDPSRQALFQVMLALQNAGRQRARAGALELGHLETAEGVAKFDLTVNLSETTAEGPGAGGLVGTFEYNTDLFDRTRIQRWVRHFHALLAGITATEGAASGAASGADRPLGALPMLSAPERHQLAQEWNDTRRPYPRDATLHGLFSAAAEDPDAVAVVLEDEEIPFEEIDQRANQLAHYLRAKGVRQDTLVALCAERAWDLMVAILGILKAGGAYVPLDPSYPAERLRFILEDTAAPVLVAHDHLLQQLPELPATLEVVRLDGDWPEIGGCSFEPPDSGVTADHLAYVMYTSGSTGRPKGVRITHRGVVRLARNDEYLDISQGSTVLQIATLAFDASTIEIWCALANGDRGGKLVLFPGDKATLGELATVLDEGGVTSAHLTTGLFQQMVEENLEGLAGLNHVLTGGDVASPIHFRRFLEAYPGKRLTNAYGPTENSVITTFRAFTQADQVGAPVSIGRPIPQTTAHVVDRKLRPMPLGCLGELVTGGDGLARDYLNRPALTAERFVPDPFSDQPGARLYRTGDLVRLRADGEFEFVGRSDHQVKVRGFRIEVGEIEAVIAQHPEVTACAVVVRHDGGPAGTEKRLAAFVVAPETVVAAMRDYLKDRLPEYMVPTLFVALEALPLTTNRKIDRKDLIRRPVTGSEAAVLAAQYTAPRNATEERLVAIWEELLGRERVGVEDDFFALGGHSLLATQMASRVEGQFGVAISLRQLFEAPTIAALAEVLEGGGAPPGDSSGGPAAVAAGELVAKEPG